MYYMKEEWCDLTYQNIAPGYLISSHGRIAITSGKIIYPAMEPSYHSSNGYDYHPFVTMKNGIPGLPVLFPIDEIVASTFIRVPKSLRNCKVVKVVHIDGDTRNNCSENLRWEEYVEEWVDAVCPITMKNGEVVNPKRGSYKVSNFGRVLSTHSGEVVLIYQEFGGHRDHYYKCTLEYEDQSGNVYRKRARIHRLVAFSFRLPGYNDKRSYVNHINGDMTDNSLKNLEFVTNQENVRHSFDMQLEVNPRGEEHPRSKFTDNQRDCIFEIIQTLGDIQPAHVTRLIDRRLPMISRDDVKYIKKLLKLRGDEFPDLSDKWRSSQKFTDEEWANLERTVDSIFDDYGIYQTEVYDNEHRKKI